jgi:putative ABC transport system permease protein
MAMSGPLRDLVHAWRGLRQSPIFLIAALATIAIGIGANVTVFSIVNGISLRPMPFGDRTDRLVTIHPTHRLATEEPDWGDSEISYLDLVDYRAAGSVEGVGGYMIRNFVLSGDASSAERVVGGSVTPELFRLLGVEPFLGRHFLPEEAAAPGLETSVMLTHSLWQRRYAADPSIIGKTIIINDGARTVVGVLPPRFQFPVRDQLYMPLRWDESPRAARNINAVALMRPEVGLEQARSEIAAIAKRLEESYPESNRGYGVQVVPIRNSYVGAEEGRIFIVLLAAVGFVLLIVCANLANLMLVRGAARQREMAVRSAMGASHGRLVWSALSESLLLALPGAGLGLLAAQWALDAIFRLLSGDLPYWVTFEVDVRVAIFTIGAAIFTAIAVGLIPSIRAATPDLINDLKEAGRGASLGRAGQRMQATLAVAQVALCFALLIGANLMVRSFMAMQTADLGFDHRQLLSARSYLAGDAFDDVQARAAFYDRAVSVLAALPGATAAAMTTAIPGDDGGATQRVVVDGRTTENDEIAIQSIAMSPQLFDVLGLSLIEGRTFTATETQNPRADVAVINQGLARRLWPGDSPLDRRIGFRGGRDINWFRVVGVVPDIHYEEVGEETEQSRLNVYLPYATSGSRSMSLLVRASGSPATLVEPTRAALQRLGAAFPIFQVMTFNDLRRFTTREQAFLGNIMATFAVMALALACLGIYALISYSVGRRAREIGVRLALGARPRDVVSMLLRESARVGGAGLVLGLTMGVLIARALTQVLYGIKVDAWLFVSMAAPLTLAIVFATWWPARRAGKVEPTVALRDE